MNTKIKCSLTLLLVFIILTLSVAPAFAVIPEYTDVYVRTYPVYDINNNELEYIKSDDYGHYEGNTIHWFQGSNTYDYSDRKWAVFCIEPGRYIQTSDSAITSNGGRVWNDLSYDQKEAISYTLVCGYYGNKAKVMSIASCSPTEACMATQLIIWEIVEGFRDNQKYGYRLKNAGNNFYQYACSATQNKALYKAYTYISDFMYSIRYTPSFFSTTSYSLNYDKDNTYPYNITLNDTNKVYVNSDKTKWKWYYTDDTALNKLNLLDSGNEKIKFTCPPLSEANTKSYLKIESKNPFSATTLTFTNVYLENCKKQAQQDFSTTEGVVLEYDYDSNFQALLVAMNPNYISIPKYKINIQAASTKGVLEINKSSALEEFTKDNDCYTLEGAIYSIYKDSELKNLVNTITTDKNGKGSVTLDAGTYYVKETKAPKGYALHPKTFTVEIKKDETIVLETQDPPQNDPVLISLRKLDMKTHQGGKALEGAQYQYEFYNGHYDTVKEVENIKPNRQWIFKTDSDGLIFYHNDYLVSGDSLYYTGDNPNPVLPLGTLIIYEKKPPEGYFIDNTKYLINIDSVTDNEIIYVYNIPEVLEEPIETFDYVVEKRWNDENDNDGIRPEFITAQLLCGDEVIDEKEISSIDNHITFSNLYRTDKNGNTLVYFVKEKDTPQGYTSVVTYSKDKAYITNTHETEKINISGEKTWSDYENILSHRPNSIKINLLQNGKVCSSVNVTKYNDWKYNFTNLPKYYDHGKLCTYTIDEDDVKGYLKYLRGNDIENKVIEGSIHIKKTDNNDNPIEGVKFKLFTKDKKEVFSNYINGEYQFSGLSECIYTTDKNGEITVTLPYGDYIIREIETKEGYMPFEDDINVSLTLDNLSKEIEVKNNKVLMYNTGSNGNYIFYIIAGIVFVISASSLIIILIIKRKEKNKNNEKNN